MKKHIRYRALEKVGKLLCGGKLAQCVGVGWRERFRSERCHRCFLKCIEESNRMCTRVPLPNSV